MNSTLDTPELVLSGLQRDTAGQAYVVIQEDQFTAKKIGVLSFSPDPTEYATVALTLSEAFAARGGKLRVAPNDDLYTLVPSADGYEITWNESQVGSFIPRTPIVVEIVPGVDYFNTQAGNDELESAVSGVQDALTIRATSRFDSSSELEEPEELPGAPVSVKLLVREANDAPELVAFIDEEAKALALEAEVYEHFESDEPSGGLHLGGSVYQFSDVDLGDLHAATLALGLRTDQLLAGTSPEMILRDPVSLDGAYWESTIIGSDGSLISNTAVAAGFVVITAPGDVANQTPEGSFVTKDGYLVTPGPSADPSSTYWVVDGMLGILRASVTESTVESVNGEIVDGEVQWELIATEKQLDFLSSGESVVQTYQLVLSDYTSDGEEKFGQLYTDVKVTLHGKNDTPEFIEALNESSPKVSSNSLTIDGTNQDGRSDVPLSMFFVDPDLAQTETSYETDWGVAPHVLNLAPELAESRLFSAADDLVSDTVLTIDQVGTYSVPGFGVNENVYEISGALPEANQLVVYKTASEELTLDVRVTLSETLTNADPSDESPAAFVDLTVKYDDVVLPNFDLLLGDTPDLAASDAYRAAIFHEGTNDFSGFDATQENITQIAPIYENVVSSFVSEDGSPQLDGQFIAVTESEGGEVLASNIYGTSGRDIILGIGSSGSLLYGGDGESHDIIIGSEGNDLILLGGGIDYVAGSQVPGYAGDEDIYVVSSLIDYTEMEDVGVSDLLETYFVDRGQYLAEAIQAHVKALAADMSYMAGIIEDLALASSDDGWEAIDRIYFDGFDSVSSQTDKYLLDSGETLLTAIFTDEANGESVADSYSVLVSSGPLTYQEHYEDAVYFS